MGSSIPHPHPPSGSDLSPVNLKLLEFFVRCSGGPFFCTYCVNKSWFVPTESINYVFNVSVCTCLCLLWKMLNFIFIHLKLSDCLMTNKWTGLFIKKKTWLSFFIALFLYIFFSSKNSALNVNIHSLYFQCDIIYSNCCSTKLRFVVSF